MALPNLKTCALILTRHTAMEWSKWMTTKSGEEGKDPHSHPPEFLKAQSQQEPLPSPQDALQPACSHRKPAFKQFLEFVDPGQRREVGQAKEESGLRGDGEFWQGNGGRRHGCCQWGGQKFQCWVMMVTLMGGRLEDELAVGGVGLAHLLDNEVTTWGAMGFLHSCTPALSTALLAQSLKVVLAIVSTVVILVILSHLWAGKPVTIPLHVTQDPGTGQNHKNPGCCHLSVEKGVNNGGIHAVGCTGPATYTSPQDPHALREQHLIIMTEDWDGGLGHADNCWAGSGLCEGSEAIRLLEGAFSDFSYTCLLTGDGQHLKTPGGVENGNSLSIQLYLLKHGMSLV
ncbi:hypothetical protein EDC04DRAFT_2612078 [Pisolithus marmoratus]|nr:hypothetical protein EDC04DRAFT_2612078 [Pisolithus marmoratus]